MQRAFLAAGFAAVVCALVGTFVVLKGLAFMGDAVAHSSLAGMSVAYFLGGNIFWGALGWAVPASLLITFISRKANLRLDASIGIIFASGFALGIILMSRVTGYAADLFGLLFGNVLGISWAEVALIGGIAAAVSLVVAAFYKELLFTSYDATMSAASGIPVRFMQYLLPVLVGVTTVASLKAVGIVLVLALLVTPSATAMLLARRMPSIMAYSVAVGLLATVLGLYLSFYADLPSGPSIVLVATGLFLLALLFSPIKGVLWRRNTLPSPSQEPAS
ncbi:MAG: manganese ABC transporter permease [Chloroflexi bacterium]|jgi:ABC-type Mn2+/Zn2+ transport system permease subunit|nr:manganese ABC transporter permease [Chloroflexota bacterium]MCH2536945.1 metal ABC transporter permease [Dehalococcoidia bacterium]MEE2928843.1 metal ABC transporter permease [Chloroflexota bacterium]HIB13177.1 metal ABC transporter permease [Dehalococcoidia bacterium]